MAIPDFQTVMLPVLEALSDGRVHSSSDLYEDAAGRLKLTIEDRKELLPSGRQSRFENRVAWARKYLRAAGK
ncbi:MAG TPA: winged helix-turn-helix domain-containing protein [Methylomirabilota bacterium]|jgi:restriction system protein|nr:winged helix-turn-helix domain-containing protein [Methylomirabilota bacterium]